MGGLSWFAIPFTLATTMGLAGRALMLDLEPEEVGAGLVLPKAAFELMGKNGAGCALLIVFMAVTSVKANLHVTFFILLNTFVYFL